MNWFEFRNNMNNILLPDGICNPVCMFMWDYRSVGVGLRVISMRRLKWILYFKGKDMNVMVGVCNPVRLKA
jgi:hypothetical protein